MKTLFFLLLVAFLLLLPGRVRAVSSGDVVGQVVDLDTHKPVPFAKVVFENYYDRVTVTANEHGYYYGLHIPEGRYQMRVVYNQRTFVMNRVKVYDSYSSEVNFFVSDCDTLAPVVLEKTPNPVIQAFQSNDIVLSQSEMGNASMSLSDVLMAQPGVNIFQGRLYVKGAPVKFFVDGSPVMVGATLIK